MTCDLSIIIVSWNTRDLLAACLASLPTATESLTCEIVVVDNASADGTPAMVTRDFPSVTLLETGSNLGFTRANNLALDRVVGQRVLLLNPDTVCPPSSLTRLVSCLDALPDAAAVGPSLTDENNHQTQSWGDFPRPWHHWRSVLDPSLCWLPRAWREVGLGRTADSAHHTQQEPDPTTGAVAVDYIKGACLLMSRAALDKVGFLDDRFFMYFEETDWCRRARDLGFSIHLCPDVTVQHLEGQATGLVSEFSMRQFQHSLRLYVAKHHGDKSVRSFRRAQRAEFRWKAFLRHLLPGAGHRALGDQYTRIADLQGQQDVAPSPPSSPNDPSQ